ncbi:MAG: hypothetical protein Q4A64_04075 [Porphyromonadaceae bacterium]|nr:hypothetical protein [Porphyromonadaceae bacterium]
MNTRVVTFLWARLALLGFVLVALFACEKEKPEEDLIWDIAPVNFSIEVYDATEANLVDPNHQQSITKTPITIEMGGKVYSLKSMEQARLGGQSGLRYYMPHFYGFTYAQSHDKERKWLLSFGEFDGAKNHNQEVTLHWGDGQKDVLSYTNQIKWIGKRGEPQITRIFYLNGEPLAEGRRVYKFQR